MFTNSRILFVLFLAVISLGLSACETMEGAGRDMSNAGEAVQEAAQ